MKSILIVDDELDIQSSLSLALREEGFEVQSVSSPDEAQKLLENQSFDLALYDVWFPVGDGVELLKWTREHRPQMAIIMMSGHGNIELALKSIRLGAYDFLEKPLELEKILIVLRNALETLELRGERERLSEAIFGKSTLIGNSVAITQLRTQIEKAAQVAAPVLILGENGSGKELVARLLHMQSPRKEKPFVAINCAAIPEGLIESELFGHEKGAFTGAIARQIGRFEQAGAGTLFLDEIAELSPQAQSKLLRVLEEKVFERVGGRQPQKSEARIVAASNRELGEEVKEGRFREDLYFRLNVLTLLTLSLRGRAEDIPLLAEHFVRLLSHEYKRKNPKVSAELLKWMQFYDWPGNVRELRNIIERMMILGDDSGTLKVSDLPEDLQNVGVQVTGDMPFAEGVELKGSLRELRAQFEKFLIEQRLGRHTGNVTRTAESLGVERAHLHRKLRQYGIAAKAETH